MPSSQQLQAGADSTLKQDDSDAGRFFQSILEVGYLVASADGFADEERHALAHLLGLIMGDIVNEEALELHFKDLDDACEMLGRRERLRRAAADFDSGSAKQQAIGFAALVALADGKLAGPELEALKVLGTHLELTDAQVGDAVQRVVGEIKRGLGG